MKLATAIALAQACEVRLEWLALGNGPMVESPGETRHSLDSQLLVTSIEVANTIYLKRGINPSARALARMAIVIYAELLETEPDDAKRRAALDADAKARSLEPDEAG